MLSQTSVIKFTCLLNSSLISTLAWIKLTLHYYEHFQVTAIHGAGVPIKNIHSSPHAFSQIPQNHCAFPKNIRFAEPRRLSLQRSGGRSRGGGEPGANALELTQRGTLRGPLPLLP